MNSYFLKIVCYHYRIDNRINYTGIVTVVNFDFVVFLQRCFIATGAQGRIRTDGFRVLQTLALGRSATCAYYW